MASHGSIAPASQEQAVEAVPEEIACEKLERQLSELHDALGTKAGGHMVDTWGAHGEDT